MPQTGQASEWAAPKLAFDPDDYLGRAALLRVEGRHQGADVHRPQEGPTGPAPTLLYGYGGFNISHDAELFPRDVAWLEQGGVYAVANIRGGGEYGKAWHDAGRLAQQAERVRRFHRRRRISEGQRDHRAARARDQGGSNGGLLVGAVVNQRPDLFDAGAAGGRRDGHAALRPFTAGRYWVDDYGHPDKEADFKTLLRLFALSQHQGRARHYPRDAGTTADTDDRVVPGHSFKYIAELQDSDPAATRRTSSASRRGPGTAAASRSPRSSRNIRTCTRSSAISRA